jgi:hypothetical protein
VNLREAQEHFGVREWGREAPMAVILLRRCIESDQGCWLRYPANPQGYTTVTLRRSRVNRLAHRALYELMVGPIPSGLQLDHVCHGRDLGCPGGDICKHRACVNPAHLEPVTGRENVLRSQSLAATNALKTHCKRGHEFTPENTYLQSYRDRVMRSCLTCRREYMRNYLPTHRAQKKQAA